METTAILYTHHMKLGFLLFALPFLGMIAICSVAVFKTGIAFGVIRSPLTRHIVTWIFALLPVMLMATMAISNKVYNVVNIFFYDIAMIWLPVLLYLFLAAVLLSIINLITVSSGHPINMFPLAIGAMAIVVGVTFFGIANATTPRIVTYDIDSPALSSAWKGKNIVLVSDTHVGIVRSKSFMEKVVNNINEQKPDVVFIAGDIIDGPVFDYAKGLSPLKRIQSTFGTIYTPGNHEGYNSEPEKFYPAVKPLVTTVIDSKVQVNDTSIIGLDYKQESKEATAERLKRIGFVPTEPTIAILHDPSNANVLLDAGVNLVVSGHTHCGQFFPINLVVKGIYKKFTYGVNMRKDSGGKITGAAVTTCGVGTAMSPLRLGTNPEIVVLHIK
jgi:predicted MPP superfamily phosphohydrolase